MELSPDISLKKPEPSLGTRFWIFPQPPFILGYEQPDRVLLSILPDEIGDGPSDMSMYVADPLFDKEPYRFGGLPPYRGPQRRPVRSGTDRHFDSLDPRSRDYLGAHAYACIHFVLDVWRNYLARPMHWFFSDFYPRLEIVPLVRWKSAQAGFGFIELGYSEVGDEQSPYALNFDTIAHEIGHLITLSQMGLPGSLSRDADFFPFSEAISDSISLISFLHFDSAIDRLLRRTKGNLLLYNELNRFAETSPETQIRLATNFRRMSDVTSEVHDRSLPFLGAIFDAIVELYHRELVASGCADHRLLSVNLRDLTLDEFDWFRQSTATAFRDRPLFFKLALTKARDSVGRAIGAALHRLDPDTMRLGDAALAIISAADLSTAAQLEENFEWREIIGSR
ncbi:hypothetical protein BAE36_26190 [Rhizobium leguminosarum bv. trifolii]|jgi:hypothetical protein|uniref:Peptidase M4 family protein n=1 Tax=Rhizobium leguminosarum bv. trifolii TaxID=386 RepID=A0A1B8R698_RHILT|nr:hypothetical protein [Rhizobium leguminosarum]AOO92887.1 hypothetical protein [Rhizobium leguminosarum bv. trifolii]MBY5914896.1 hypothetical protein [Rhizobium leguminosarum]MDH6274244.1 hypothetical protein [Rhizobium leguminosarum]MVO93673.1 hypothetical protein [Rhizobium leguminosarum bv. phaseoli]OBY04318.1 hypothetical protein BAE36_26190 [Rhizobium leguminosarum bv. trifolii]